MTDVLIVPTGIANVASVEAAFRRLGANPRLCDDKAAIASAAAVVLPGVGTFGAGMQRLSELDLVAPLRDRIRAGFPTLAICLGLQLLARGSAESPGVTGLGILDATITRLPATVRVPQLGWNHVEPNGTGALEAGLAVFANTYCLESAPLGWTAATTNYGTRFVSALARGAVLACQFHPEISGDYGQRLLGRWLETALETV
ncbi:MAG: imidazole glycerol phosphate synthase subunit HisH [bacterium]|nr:imidazole glycerol phosphate synthase subunit HisH [bacterium]